MTAENKVFSLDDLDATRASDKAFEFEFIDSKGNPSGVFLSVLGGESKTVTNEVTRMVNERRYREAAREVRRKIGVGVKAIEFEPMESDTEFGRRLAAVRIVGWRGISDPFSPENALRLCMTNSDVAKQVTQQSDAMANFTGL